MCGRSRRRRPRRRERLDGQDAALIEARTTASAAHSMRDPAGAVYRTKRRSSARSFAIRFPFREKALKAGWLSEADVRAIEKDVNDPSTMPWPSPTPRRSRRSKGSSPDIYKED